MAPEHELKALSGALYALCDTAHSLAALVKTTGRPAAELEPVLQDLVRRKLMLEIDGQYPQPRGDEAPGAKTHRTEQS